MNSANNKVDELVDIICRLLIAEANTGREREREWVVTKTKEEENVT